MPLPVDVATAVPVKPSAPPAVDRSPAPSVVASIIMPTTAWSGTFEPSARRVLQVLDRSSVPCEFVVAFDGPSAAPPAWLERPRVTVVATGRRSGPAVARNVAAESARGRILFFVDADVVPAPDALDRVLARFDADPDLVAVFGCYDDEPAAPGVVSRFRNLLHHHTHLTHPGPAGTFWAGCGAIRTVNFLDVGGFDGRFGRPSIEDIELGIRVTAAGGRIELDPGVRCKHLKRWTLGSMLMTDVFSRAVPWTRLLVEMGELPATLNIDRRSRASGICALAAAASLGAAPWIPAALGVTAACLGAVLAINADFYGLCRRKGGLVFAGGAAALHVLYFLYSSLTFGIVTTWLRIRGSARASACRPRPAPRNEPERSFPAALHPLD